MQDTQRKQQSGLARIVGWTLIASIVIGVLASIFIRHGIDINLNADPALTAANMLDAELRVRGSAYVGLLMFSLEALVSIGLFLLLLTKSFTSSMPVAPSPSRSITSSISTQIALRGLVSFMMMGATRVNSSALS